MIDTLPAGPEFFEKSTTDPSRLYSRGTLNYLRTLTQLVLVAVFVLKMWFRFIP